MLQIDFTTSDTLELHKQLAYAYGTKELVERLLPHAGIPLSSYPAKETEAAAWEAFLIQLQKSEQLDKLLHAVLADPDSLAIHTVVQTFLDRQAQTSDIAESNGGPEASAQLVFDTFSRQLGADGRVLARKLVERLASVNNISGSQLFDATRFAIEYHLLSAEEITPALLIDVAYGRREPQLEQFRLLLRDAVKRKAIRGIEVRVEPHTFFSRTVERQADWYAYFDAVRRFAEDDPAIGCTLCCVRTKGFVAPQFLIAGLLPRFEDDWRPIIAEYEHQIEGAHSAFISFQASQWNTWLMWGPSIPICQCCEWDGIRAFQYGYGDENNSMPIIGVARDAPTSLEDIATAYEPKDPSVGAVLRRMKGRLRWGPWLFRRNGAESRLGDRSGELYLAGLQTSPAARAQRLIYEKDRQGDQRDALLFQVEEVRDAGTAPQSYFSAYLWLMFLVARKVAEPGQAPRRLADTYPALQSRSVDRRAKRLWRELLPVYVHANIADANALALQRRALVNNAIGLLRQIWTEQPTLFPDVDRSELCFHLVGGSDYSGCGHQIRFPSCDPLIERLRTAIAAESDRDFATSIVLPVEDETKTTRPSELAAFYSTCRLPDLVADYYAYVDEQKEDSIRSGCATGR